MASLHVLIRLQSLTGAVGKTNTRAVNILAHQFNHPILQAQGTAVQDVINTFGWN